MAGRTVVDRRSGYAARQERLTSGTEVVEVRAQTSSGRGDSSYRRVEKMMRNYGETHRRAEKGILTITMGEDSEQVAKGLWTMMWGPK